MTSTRSLRSTVLRYCVRGKMYEVAEDERQCPLVLEDLTAIHDPHRFDWVSRAGNKYPSFCVGDYTDVINAPYLWWVEVIDD